MSGAVRAYIDRSMNVLKRNTAKVMRMDGTNQPPPLPLLEFSSSSASASSSRLTPISSLATGSDADIGGLSTCSFAPQPEPRVHEPGQAAEQQQEQPQTHVAMHGNLSLAVPPAYAGRIRTGYAAFRTKTRPSLFGEETWDLSLYSHLRMKVAYRGLEGWRDRWYVNIQTDGPVQSDLFQHRLHLPPTSSSPSSSSSPSLPSSPSDGPAPTFHTVHLPLSSFLLTNSGKTSSTQLPMMRERVRTIGISLLGGGRSTEDAPPVPASSSSSAVAGPSAGTFAEAQRLAAGGWKGGADAGKGGKEVYVDEEMEALMRSDLPAGAQLPGRVQQQQQQPQSQQAVSRPSATGGYHRVGSASLPPASVEEVPPAPTAEGTPEEGYFELSIKSVEAVRWDPEAEDGPAE